MTDTKVFKKLAENNFTPYLYGIGVKDSGLIQWVLSGD